MLLLHLSMAPIRFIVSMFLFYLKQLSGNELEKWGKIMVLTERDSFWMKFY